MAGQIPQSFIDDLLERVDIVEVIDRRVPLKKAGKNYKACCPFHNEKTPSFNVQPDKQYYHCFGCGAGGNAISFLLDYEKLNFVEAIEALAAQAGVEVPREQTSGGDAQQKQRVHQLYEAINFAARFYQTQLRQHPNKTLAVSYLKQRGVSGEVARDFGIGYAPAGWDNLLNAAAAAFGDKKEVVLKQLANVGLLVAKDNGSYYDRFRERVMFPIHDNRGRIIAFGGRVLNDDKPKYLNSPESEVFHKQRELYGLYEARKRNRQLDQIVLVEGYLDVISLFQFGINYAVATLGTASGEAHLEKIFRHTHKLIVCFDGDDAGVHAAERVLDTALPAMRDGREINFLFLPEGSDPDSYVREHGKAAFEHLCEGAMPLEQMLLKQAGKDTSLDSEAGKTRFCQNALPLLQRLPEGMFKHRMLTQLAEYSDTPRDLLVQQLADLPAPRDSRQYTAQSRSNTGNNTGNNTASNTSRPKNNDYSLSERSPSSSQQMARSTPASHAVIDNNAAASHKPTASSATTSQPVNESNETALMWAAAAVLSFPSLAIELQLPDAQVLNSPMGSLLNSLVELINSHDQSTGTPPSTEFLVGHWHGESEAELILRCLGAEVVPAEARLAKQLLDDALQKVERNQQKAALDTLAKRLGEKQGELSEQVKQQLKALGQRGAKRPPTVKKS